MIPREEIISMAREAGWVIQEDVPYADVQAMLDMLLKRLERFAALVEAHAAAAEREACANLCDRHAEVAKLLGLHARAASLSNLSAAIRARGAA